MIRILRALAWLRWRLLINAARGKGGRDLGERLSRVSHILIPFLIPLLVLPTALGLGLLAFLGGRFMGEGRMVVEPEAVFILRLLAGLATAVVVLLPIARARSAGKTLNRMLLLPISRRLFHLADVVAGLADPWLLVLLPAIFLLPVGIITTGPSAAGAAAGMAMAGVGLTATLLGLASAVSLGVQLLLRDRRRAEALILVGTIAISVVGFLPAFFLNDIERRDRPEEEPSESEAAAEEGTGIHLSIPDFLPFLPSELYVKQLEASTDGKLSSAWPAVGLLLQAMVAYGLSAGLHRRLLENPERTSRSRGGARRNVRVVGLPGITAQASAVALAQSRTFLRTVKGKIAVYLGPVMGLLLGILLFYQLDLPALPGGHVAPFTLMAGLFCIVALQPVLLNLFATDGAGLTLQFLGPISDRELVQGKLVATGVMVAVPTLLCGGIAWGLLREGSILLWLAALAGVAATYLLFAPIAAVLSVLLPRNANLNSMGKDGNPHALAGFVGVFLVGACATPTVLLAAFAMLVLKSQVAALLMVLGWTGLAAGIGHVLAGVAGGMLGKRRENVALVAQGR